MWARLDVEWQQHLFQRSGCWEMIPFVREPVTLSAQGDCFLKSRPAANSACHQRLVRGPSVQMV